VAARAEALLLGLLALLSLAWFSPQYPRNDQVVTRLALTLAIVERGELTIDRFAGRTVDKASFGGHTYADKAPGLSLLAVPAVAATRLALVAAGQPSDGTDRLTFALYSRIATVATNGVASALAVALLFLVALRLGAQRGGARLAAVALAIGTPFFGWSTAFFAHAMSGSVFVATLALGVAAHTGERRLLHNRPLALGILLGLMMGVAVTIDFTTVPLLAIGAVTILVLAVREGLPRLMRTGAGLLLGGIAGILPLLVYNQLAFGSPFTLGYTQIQLFAGMRQGLFGLTWPNPKVAAELLFGEYRGLLPLSPVLALAPFGVVAMLRSGQTRLIGLLVVAAFAIFLWINASYFYWKGGNSTGPRFLVPMLPFLCLALAFAWPANALLRVVVLLLLAASAVLSVICAGGDMFAPELMASPLRDYLVPRFLAVGALPKAVVVLMVWAVAAGVLAWRDRRATAA
jgi:hypothetical protein